VGLTLAGVVGLTVDGLVVFALGFILGGAILLLLLVVQAIKKSIPKNISSCFMLFYS
jgi:hypothetical protein